MNLLTFDLNLLKVLDALLSEGSTVGAARKVGLSQPAVSSALNRLRHALGDPLFVRAGQRLEATDRARELAIPVRDILESVETVLTGPGSFDPAHASFTFRLSGSDFFSEMLMPELASRLSGSAPGIRVQMVDLVPDNHVGTIEQYKIDLALSPATTYPEWIDNQPVFRSALDFIAREGHPRLSKAKVKPGETIPVDLYCDLSHILFSQEGKLKGMGDAALANAGRQRHVALTMPSFLGICRAVSESDMVALIPHSLAQRIADKLNLAIYRPPMRIDLADIHMMWHKRATNNSAHRWLRSLVADILIACDDDPARP